MANTFTVTLWNGQECFALWPETPPRIENNREVRYIVTNTVADGATLRQCIDDYNSKKGQTK